MKRRDFLKHSSQLLFISTLSSKSSWLTSSPLLSGFDFDLLIKKATIINGLGEMPFIGEIGIKEGKIVYIGRPGQIKSQKDDILKKPFLAEPNLNWKNQRSPAQVLQNDRNFSHQKISVQARQIIDAQGKIVCPGFIDIHSHTGVELLINPQAESKVRQGVTTEIGGNCGSSDFPLKEVLREKEKRYLERLGIKERWTDLKSFSQLLESKKISLNWGTLIGHGTVRAKVVGEEKRAPSPTELEKMKKLIAQAMEQGAFGLSTGLEYTPSGFADRDELIELCRVVASYGGIYATHMRSEDNEALEALGEALSIALEAQLPLQISHLKACGQRNFWKMPYLFDLIEKAKEKSIEVTADVYPYTAYSTGLTVFFPLWALALGEAEFLRKLKSPEERQKMKAETEEKLGGMPWENVLIVNLGSDKNKALIGKNIAQAAKERGQECFDFVCELLIEEKGDVSIVGFGMSEDNLIATLRHPLVMIASDGSALAPYGPLHQGKPHPRNYGTFPRFLGYYVREKKIISLPEAIRKITSLPASKLGLKDRGVIKEGFFADLVIFDQEKIADRATYIDPEQYPLGIDYVIVNGKIVIDHGEHTGQFPGKFLHGPGRQT
ncbi:MAG: D-aminoacylase [Candidatus Aminicenantes bacterium]|nr:D-aminoacylase [Candidatus Aminicenantes bacterium]